MAENTAGTLDPRKLRRIQAIVTAKFAAKRSEEDKEDALWSRCKTALEQKCKALRAA